MAQVSYGTITITDTNDIEEIFSLYGGSNDANTSPTYSYAAITDGTTWKRNVTAITNYKYIWQITVITKTGITVDSSNWQQFYGAPIRITGEEGDDARNIIAVTPYYYLSSSNSSQTGGNWSTSPQAYPSTGVYYYWTKTITTYDSGSPSESTPVLDMFLTNAAKDARDANATAALANSIAQHANYEINSLNVRTKNFFKGLDNSYDGWFASGRTEDNGLNVSDAETYLYNARLAATHISLGYNKTPIIDLDGGSGSINIYRFPTINNSTKKVTAAGSLGMKLSATDLIFYKPPVGDNDPVAAATLNANGLNIVDGSIELANGTNDSVKISNSDFTRNINSISRNNLRMAIGSKFGVKNDGTLYASNANISGTIAVGTGSSISADTQINGDAASTVVSNASHGQSAYTNGIRNAVTEVQYAISSNNDNNHAPSSISYTSNLNALNWTTTNRYVWTRTKITKTPINGVASVEYQPSEAGTYDKPLSDALYVANTANTTANEAAPKTDAMYRTQRIYWRSTYNSLLDTTPTPQINQTWLTTSGSGYGNWSLTVPPMTVDIVNYIKLTVIDSAAKVDDLQEIQLVYASSNGSASYPTYNYNSVFGNSPVWEDNLENADGENIWMGIGVILESQPITSNNFATYFYTPVQINNLVNGTTFGSRGLTTTIEYCNSNAQNIQNLSDSEEWISTIPAWNNEKTNYYVKINTTVKFPYLFTALQIQTVNQYNGGVGVGCSCSEVLLDNTTTIIDGGSIITGTIDVNKLSAYDATIGQIKAGVIQGLDRKIDMSPDATGTSLEESFNTIKNTLVFQAEQIYFSNDTVESDVHNLLDSYVQNITINTGSEGTSPYIQVGQSTGFYVQITQNRLSFMHGSTDPTKSPIEIAYIDGERNQLFIGQSVVLEEMDVGDPLNGLGQWAWTVHANTESVPRNNLTLKWLG